MLLVSDAPSPTRSLSRRSVLLGAGRGLVGLTLLGAAATAAACGSDKPVEPDKLIAQLKLARADAEMATAAAAKGSSALVAAFKQIALERGEHARALSEEIDRVAGAPLSSTTVTTTAADTPAPATPTRRDVVAALRHSAESAAGLAATESGYRAGLLGSIAAACTASHVVGLPEEPKP